MGKTAVKTTAKSTGGLRPQPHGGALRNGGTNAGGTGRPPDEFKARMRELVKLADQRGHVERVLMDPDHPQWLGALKWAAEHGHGKPSQPVEHTGKDGGPLRLVIERTDEDGSA